MIALERPQSRTRKVLDYMGLYSAGDWAALILALVLAVLLAFLFAAWWAA